MNNGKYVFDTEGDVELGLALTDRLFELGFDCSGCGKGPFGRTLNVSVGLSAANQVLYGALPVDASLFNDHEELTLSCLYGADKPEPQPVPEPAPEPEPQPESEPVPELELIVGNAYRDRSGGIVKITESGTLDCVYPFRGICTDAKGCQTLGAAEWYCPNGDYWFCGRESRRDLIEEVYAQPTVYITVPEGIRVEIDHDFA